jgi:hypothetical protein
LSSRRSLVAGVIASLLLVPLVHAGAPSIAQAEINQLLTVVGISGCEFYRNGSWYDAKTAESHLRNKYQLLTARSQVKSAEDFIGVVATRSSLSGIPYKVRCSGGVEFKCSLWLHDELLRYRARAHHS